MTETMKGPNPWQSLTEPWRNATFRIRTQSAGGPKPVNRVRLALGAQASDVLKLIVNQGMWSAVIGVAIGTAASFALTRLIQSLLFGVSATDPASFLLISLLLMAVAFLACYLPAKRATRVNPLVALRYE